MENFDRSKYKIVFFGTPDFAVPSLDALCKAGYDVAAVVTATDKPAGRSHKLLPSAVKRYAVENSIPVLQPEKLKSPEFVETLREIDADLFVVIAFRMLPEVVWSMPRYGTFNLHGSLLPAYRGAAPINWAVINGEQRTGITTFFISHEIDTGDIIDSRTTEITPEDNAGSVHDRLMEMGAELTLSTADSIFQGTISPVSQEDVISKYGVMPSPAPKIFKETCVIDWNRPARQVVDFIRGLAPYPAAIASMNVNGAETVVKILSAKVAEDGVALQSPGTIVQNIDPVSHKPRILVAADDGWVAITSLQLPGKRPVTPVDIANGNIALS